MLSRFSPVGRRSSGREHSNPSTDGPSAPSFYLQDARYPSAQFWRCAPEEDVQAQKIKAEILGKDVEGIVLHQRLSYVREKKLENLLQGILVATNFGLRVAGRTCQGIL